MRKRLSATVIALLKTKNNALLGVLLFIWLIAAIAPVYSAIPWGSDQDNQLI